MKFDKPYSLKQIAELISCEYIGDKNQIIEGINEIHRVQKNELVFVDHPKYYEKALSSNATTILIDKQVVCPEGKSLIISKQPFDDFNKIARHFRPYQNQKETIESLQIHPTAVIFPNVSIGKSVTIEAGACLYPGVVVLDHVHIGKNAVIGPNTVLGFHAFYYKKKAGVYDQMHTCGGVHIEENVEIGASCTIDAGVTETTIIGKGTKIDNQVQIGHDTHIGENCLIAAQTGIAGCVTIENNVTIWGQVGSTSGITIGEGATILAQSGVGKSLAPNQTYFGSPCDEVKTKFREIATLKNLPKLLENLKK